jgi:hypothetical protein
MLTARIKGGTELDAEPGGPNQETLNGSDDSISWNTQEND